MPWSPGHSGTIRDKHLLKYIEPDAHLLDPGPEPDKPQLDSIRDQIKILDRINLIDEYEESDDEEYVNKNKCQEIPPSNNNQFILDQFEKLSRQLDNSIQSINVTIVAAMQPMVTINAMSATLQRGIFLNLVSGRAQKLVLAIKACESTILVAIRPKLRSVASILRKHGKLCTLCVKNTDGTIGRGTTGGGTPGVGTAGAGS